MLKFAASDYNEIRRHGEEAYPHECCGILIGASDGETRVVRSIVRCVNTRTDSPQDRYDIDPRELITAQRVARERGQEIVGFYHSHPDHPAHWSKTDLEQALWTGYSYVITSVEKGKAAATKSFVLVGNSEENKAFEHEDVEVVS
jgi:proteasome lid subunit RPN8/RPN11